MKQIVKYKPEECSYVSLEESDVEITPGKLKFSETQVPVDVDLPLELHFKNIQNTDVCLHFYIPKEQIIQSKYMFKVDCCNTFILKPLEEKTVVLTLRVLCTTKFDVKLYVDTWKLGCTMFKKVMMPIRVQSCLSPKIDPDELEVGEFIGAGGFGYVYRGKYRGMDVAIKSCKPGIDEKKWKHCFMNEVYRLKDIRHSAIENFIGVDCIGMKLVTELAQYGSLDYAMKTYPESFNEALKIKCLLNVSEAMNFLHHSGIIHRDLKEQNILITCLSPECDVCAKVSGFGFSSDFSLYETEKKHTNVGTLFYKAPEMLKGEGYKKSVDMYSYGIAMYKTLVDDFEKKTKMSGFSDFTFIKAIINGQRPTIPSSCPEELSELIKKCWDGDPTKRPSFDYIEQFLRDYSEKIKSETSAMDSHMTEDKMKSLTTCEPACFEVERNPAIVTITE